MPDAPVKHKGKAGQLLEYKTTVNVCLAIEQVTHSPKKANSCCSWHPPSLNHCWDAWTTRWNFALEITWNAPDKRIQTTCSPCKMVGKIGWYMSHSQVALDPSNSALSSDINRVSLAVKAVHGNYTEWSDWSDCSTSCGSGEKFRTRNCTNPPPAFGGMDCSFVGMDRDVQKCEKRACAGEYYGLSVLYYYQCQEM